MTKKTAVKKKKITFEVLAEPKSKVFIAGSFNNWSDTKKELVDKKGDGYYTGALILAPGEYEYKFVINGEWQIDPENPNFNQNKMGTLNSVVRIEIDKK